MTNLNRILNKPDLVHRLKKYTQNEKEYVKLPLFIDYSILKSTQNVPGTSGVSKGQNKRLNYRSKLHSHEIAMNITIQNEKKKSFKSNTHKEKYLGTILAMDRYIEMSIYILYTGN